MTIDIVDLFENFSSVVCFIFVTEWIYNSAEKKECVTYVIKPNIFVKISK